jgi:hypothetical protein
MKSMKVKLLMSILLFSFFIISCGDKNEDDEIKRLEKETVFSFNEKAGVFVLDGTINSKAFSDFKKLVEVHPEAKWIHIVNCDGSINDDVNLSLCNYIHKNGYHTSLLEYGLVSSGGTDFFLAGNYRLLGKDVRVGVHSWAGDGKVATDFPKGHRYHQPYIEYYKNVGMNKLMAEEFYYFTINSAKAEGMHWMTKAELNKYGFEIKP